MTQWGIVLLGVYVALGLIPGAWRKAGRLAAILTVVLIAVAFAQYGAVR
jgi:hypothetical protein